MITNPNNQGKQEMATTHACLYSAYTYNAYIVILCYHNLHMVTIIMNMLSTMNTQTEHNLHMVTIIMNMLSTMNTQTKHFRLGT